MSFDEWINNKKKKKPSSFEEWSNASRGISKKQAEEDEKKRQAYLASRHSDDDDIAPVGGSKDSWFKSGGFSDGVDGVGDFFGDLGETVLGTAGDIGFGMVKGAGRMVEGLVDLGTYGVAKVGDWLGEDEFAEKARDVARYNAVDEWISPIQEFGDRNSILGNKADMVSEGLGQVGAIILTGGAGAAAGLGGVGVTALTTGLTGLSGMGSGIGEAYEGDATDEEAFWYGLGTGAWEAATELLSGGLGKSVKALGLSRGIGGLDDIFAKKLSSAITKSIGNKSVQNALGNTLEYAVKAGGEGLEEVLSGAGSAVMKWLTYEDDETLGKLIEDENLLDQFVVGAITSSIAQGADYVKANASGRDFVTGYTSNEQAVIDKEVERRVSAQEKGGKKLTTKEINAIEEQVQEDMEHGQLDIEMIDEVLGGESYKAYKDTIKSEDDLKAEYDRLADIKKSDLTTAQEKRLAELESMNLGDTTKRDELRKELNDTVFPQLKDSKLAESYNQVAKKGEAFKADLSKYKGKQREAVERAVKSGVLNDTYRSHVLVDTLSRIESDKGITFDYTNNAKLKESGFAVEGRIVNGYVNKNTGSVTLNVQSAQAWQSVVGHEITHVLEGTEAYGALRNALYAYAESKGELEGRRASVTELYRDMGADVESELTADLVGDYLFTDKSFVDHLTGNRNLFQKVYDEIKYLCKVATGKELTEIEKVKREFDRAWKEMSVGNKAANKESGKTQYSLDAVEAVQPKSDKWARTHTTEEAMTVFPDMWNVSAEESEVRNPTQITSTVNTYRKIYNLLQNEGFGGKILDASSGLGYGTKAGIEEYGFDVEDIEPYPDANYEPKYQDYSSLDEKYDVVISNAVLNVLPQDQRDALTVKMGELLNDGGRLFVNVRGKDVETLAKTGKNIHLGNMEWIETVKGSYQKGFTKSELVAYLQDALGEGFTVKPSNAFGGVAAVVTKDGGKVQYSISPETEGKTLYTGSPNTNIQQFKVGGVEGSRQSGDRYGRGVYLTTNENTAKGYAGDSGKVYEINADRLNIFNLNDLITDEMKATLQRELNGKDKQFRNSVLRNFRSEKAFTDFDSAEQFFDEQRKLWKAEDGYYAANKPDIKSANDKTGEAVIEYTDFANIDNAIGNLTGNELYDALKSISTDDFASFITGHGFDGISFDEDADNQQYVIYRNEDRLNILNNDIAPTPDVQHSLSADSDADYMSAVERGDTEAAQRMVNEATEKAGYTSDASWRMQHTAPNSRDDVSLHDIKESGLVPDDYWDHPSWYTQSPEERESFFIVKRALEASERNRAAGADDDTKIWVYRAVDKNRNVRESHVRNGDWVTPSYGYAVNEGVKNPHGYRIIKHMASIKDLYWDGNSIAELGYDDQNSYAYADTKNNRKLLDPVVYDDDGNVIPLSKRFNRRNEDVRYSLSEEGEEYAPVGNYSTPFRELALKGNIAPVETAEKAAPAPKTAQTNGAEEYPEVFAPASEEEVNALNKTRFETITDADMPPEMPEPYYGESIEPVDPFENRDMEAVGNRAVKAYMYENPEVKPFFQQEAEVMLGDLYRTTQGERIVDAQMLYETGGEAGVWGVKRHTAPDIAELKDRWGYTYDEIEAGIKAIIEDNGKENNACSKRIEFMLNDRLMNGYQDFVDGLEIPANREYINLINEKGITEYNEEARKHFFENAESYIPPVEEDIAPVAESAPATEAPALENIPVLPDDELEHGTNEAITPEEEEVSPSDVIDKPAFFSDRASALYEEVRNMRKGKRVSRELGYLLDHLDLSEENKSESYDRLRTALTNIKNRPDQVVNERSEVEALAREMIGEAYDEAVYGIDDLVAKRLKAVQDNIARNESNRKESFDTYEQQIAQKQAELDSKKNKNTVVANNLRMQIERLRRLRDTTDAQYANSIEKLAERAKKMQDPKYSRAMHKRAKMEADAKWAEDLLGDTSTWVDKKIGLQYATNTERRNLRDIVRDGQGKQDIARADAIDDALGGQYNREQYAKNRELAQVRSKYAELKITKAEDAYIQMLGELRHNPDTTLTEETVREYYEAHKSKIDTAKVDRVIELARQDYDAMFDRLNAELREQGMREIPYRQGYFPHFTEPKQNFVQRLLNWKTQDNEIPTSIAGLTETFKPVRTWQAFDKTRHGDETDYSFMKGFDSYSDGALDWIYHMDTLQKRRAVENHIRYTHSSEGIQKRIDAVYNDLGIDADEAQAQIEAILAEGKNPLNNFVQDFTTHTNILAGKKNTLDRTVEQWTNRHIYSVMTNVQNRLSANMVAGNVRSALTNFIPITQSWAQVSPMRSLQAAKDTIANAFRNDGVVDKSTFLTNRLKEADKLYQSNWDKVIDKAGVMFDVVDGFSSQVIWRSKYNQNLARGMSEDQAIKNADQFAENVMAGRSKGNEPTLFNAKNPLAKAFTAFQLEVNNQYGYFFKDVPNDLKEETNRWRFNLVKGYATAFIGAHIYNELLEKVTGSEAALDPIGIIEDLLKDLGLFDEDEEKEPKEAFENLKDNVLEQMPFVGGYLGGGRLPISTALPIKELVTGKDQYGNDKSRLETLAEAAPYTLAPFGYGQYKKTKAGLKMFFNKHPVSGSYTDKGNLRFPVEDTPLNRAQAAIFGQYASENAREYFDEGYAPLEEKQIQEYIDVDIPIKDYWEYREGLKGLTKNEEKIDYIAGLDLPVSKKNILANNVLDRKELVDLANYDDFSDYEEFDFASKNPEKWDFLQSNNISYSDFAASEESKEAYNWAYNNPELYAVSKAVTDDVVEYRRYSSDLNKIKGDNKKEDKRRYIFGLDIDHGAKCVLFKYLYNADDTYNDDVIDYITNHPNLTYDEMVSVLTKVGFRVGADGQIYVD